VLRGRRERKKGERRTCVRQGGSSVQNSDWKRGAAERGAAEKGESWRFLLVCKKTNHYGPETHKKKRGEGEMIGEEELSNVENFRALELRRKESKGRADLREVAAGKGVKDLGESSDTDISRLNKLKKWSV